MKQRVCPVWVGYLLLNPLRKLLENPRKLFGAYVTDGMYVLEPGCGPGYFTLPLAEMVGPEGRVIGLDVQEKMLDIVRRRAQKAGLADRVELRVVQDRSLGNRDLEGRMDLAVAMHMVMKSRIRRHFCAMFIRSSSPVDACTWWNQRVTPRKGISRIC